MDMSMTTTTLSFGDTFTLPVTGEHLWKLHDIRPAFAHFARNTDMTAAARCDATSQNAFYSLTEGWHVPAHEHRYEAVKEQLERLEFVLPHKSDYQWSIQYRRMLRKETTREVGEVIDLIDTWTKGTTIDPLDLRAHVAATAALAAVGGTDGVDVNLFTVVYNATLDALKEQQK